MNEAVRVAYDAGYQITTHCIGDGANNQMISAYGAAIKASPRDGHRLRIEHFQIATPAGIDCVISPGILPFTQTIRATPDMLVVGGRAGSKRIKGAYT